MNKDFNEFIQKIESERLKPLREKNECASNSYEQLALTSKIHATEVTLQLLEEYHQWLSN